MKRIKKKKKKKRQGCYGFKEKKRTEEPFTNEIHTFMALADCLISRIPWTYIVYPQRVYLQIALSNCMQYRLNYKIY